jgi:hypothetical protein
MPMSDMEGKSTGDYVAHMKAPKKLGSFKKESVPDREMTDDSVSLATFTRPKAKSGKFKQQFNALKNVQMETPM